MSSNVPLSRLENLLEVTSSKRIHMADYVESGVPFYRSKEVIERSKGNKISTELFISRNQFETIKNKFGHPQDGDILLTSVGTLGVPYLIKGDGDFYFKDGNLTWMRNFTNKISPRFLYYWLTSPLVQQKLDEISIGSTQKALTISALKSLEIPLPTKVAQDEIVEILDSISDRITLLRETNTTLEAIAQALFKSWFVDFDPVHAKQQGREPEGIDASTAALFPDSFEESELGLVPMGWRNSTLGAICKENSGTIQTGPFGSQLHASDYREEGTPVVMPQDLAGRRIQVSKISRVGEDDVSRLVRHQLRLNDIVFSRRGDVGRHALISEREIGWLCGTGCLLVRPGATWPSSIYLSLALDRTDAKEWLLRHAVGATMPNLNTGILNAVPIMLPDFNILSAFDEIVRSLDEKISNNHTQIYALSGIRDTLLPRLISGQLRLPLADTLSLHEL